MKCNGKGTGKAVTQLWYDEALLKELLEMDMYYSSILKLSALSNMEKISTIKDNYKITTCSLTADHLKCDFNQSWGIYTMYQNMLCSKN